MGKEANMVSMVDRMKQINARELEAAAHKIAEAIWDAGAQKLPAEVLKIDETSYGIVADVDGVDYILIMTRVPKQRPRPINN